MAGNRTEPDLDAATKEFYQRSNAYEQDRIPIFKNPQTEEAIATCEVCQK